MRAYLQWHEWWLLGGKYKYRDKSICYWAAGGVHAEGQLTAHLLILHTESPRNTKATTPDRCWKWQMFSSRASLDTDSLHQTHPHGRQMRNTCWYEARMAENSVYVCVTVAGGLRRRYGTKMTEGWWLEAWSSWVSNASQGIQGRLWHHCPLCGVFVDFFFPLLSSSKPSSSALQKLPINTYYSCRKFLFYLYQPVILSCIRLRILTDSEYARRVIKYPFITWPTSQFCYSDEATLN